MIQPSCCQVTVSLVLTLGALANCSTPPRVSAVSARENVVGNRAPVPRCTDQPDPSHVVDVRVIENRDPDVEGWWRYRTDSDDGASGGLSERARIKARAYFEAPHHGPQHHEDWGPVGILNYLPIGDAYVLHAGWCAGPCSESAVVAKAGDWVTPLEHDGDSGGFEFAPISETQWLFAFVDRLRVLDTTTGRFSAVDRSLAERGLPACARVTVGSDDWHNRGCTHMRLAQLGDGWFRYELGREQDGVVETSRYLVRVTRDGQISTALCQDPTARRNTSLPIYRTTS